MGLNIPVNEKEMHVARKAIEAYRWHINEIKKQEEFLKNMKFKFGDYIIKKGSRALEREFGCGNGSIGKIVGYDFEAKYYRVYYNKRRSYIGVVEEDLEKYTGEVPLDVRNYNPYNIESIHIHL